MKKRSRLLLLDADVVIELFRQGIWDELIDRCDVHLSQTVAGEARFYEDELGEHCYFDLGPYMQSKSITVFAVTVPELGTFRRQFGPAYLEQLDLGESESLIYLQKQQKECRICSAEKIAFP